MEEKQNRVELRLPEQGDYNYSEAIKTLRTNIRFCGRNVKVVMFTSSLPDEGKSAISLNFAVSMAKIGNRVLFIDSDIRKSVLISRYSVEGRIFGLTQYLTGQIGVTEAIYETGIENLSMIFAGPYSPNPAELLEDEYFEQLLEYGREHYDYVVIDTPPVGSVIDGVIVARHCDGAVIVIESGAVSYRLVQKVKKQIEMSGCRILGAVLNKVDLKAESYYSGYGYSRYGKYGKYGKYGYGAEKNEKQQK